MAKRRVELEVKLNPIMYIPRMFLGKNTLGEPKKKKTNAELFLFSTPRFINFQNMYISKPINGGFYYILILFSRQP